MSKRGRAPIIPVTVLMGSPGSGKTTLMKHMLNDGSHNMKFAVIENGLHENDELAMQETEFSEKVDKEEEITDIVNGCYSCYLRSDLVRALKRLYAKAKVASSVNGVIIETNGMTDPIPVIQTFLIDETLQQMYKLDSVIAVVDANSIVDRLDEQKPEGIENEAIEQIVFADKIILNKMDLFSSSEAQVAKIEARLRQFNLTAPILRASYGKIAPKELLNVRAFDMKQILHFQPPPEGSLPKDQGHQQRDSSIVFVTIRLKGNVNMELLTQWIHRIIAEDGANLKRYKGVVAVKGKAEKLVVQGVGMLMMGSFEGTWKKGERRECRFAFIGKYLDVEYLKDGFKACLVTKKPPRFGIGTRVLANCGKWKRGIVLKHWDEGNVYRIRLDTNDEVWAPLDIDQYIKRI